MNITVKNTSNRPVFFDGGLSLGAGDIRELNDELVGERLVREGLLTVLDGGAPVDTDETSGEETTETPNTDTPADEGSADAPLQEYADKIISKEVTFAEDEFTSKDVPTVEALEEAFDRAFTANERNDIWALVKAAEDED